MLTTLLTLAKIPQDKLKEMFLNNFEYLKPNRFIWRFLIRTKEKDINDTDVNRGIRVTSSDKQEVVILICSHGKKGSLLLSFSNSKYRK